MDSPLLSVIVPIYNVEKYLQRCVDSLVRQDFTNFEVILVDDGSTDTCPEICDTIVKKDPRFKVIHKKNEGVAIARKVGFYKACGKYVHFLDSDDWLEKNAYSTCLTSDFDYDVIFFGFSRISENSAIIYQNIPNADNDVRNILTNDGSLSFLIWNKIFKKSLLDTIDFSITDGLTFSEDSLISVSALCKCRNIKMIELPLYNYFYRIDSVTRKMNEKNHQDEFQATLMIVDILKQNNFPTDTPLINRKKFNCKYYLVEIDYSKSIRRIVSDLKKWNSIFPKIERYADFSEKTKFERIFIKSASMKFYILNVILFLLKKYLHNNGYGENKPQCIARSKTIDRDVSVIIVNYNTKYLIKDCIKAIIDNTEGINFEIIVSDNGSVDGSCEMIRSEFPDVRIIENKKNLGFGTANNRGLTIARGKYVFYLNSDTVIKNNALKIFFDYFEEHGKDENIGVIGCNLIDIEGNTVLSKGSFPNFTEIIVDALKANYGLWKLFIQSVVFRHELPDTSKQKLFYDNYLGDVDYVVGADLFLMNDDYARFDENIFLYIEEVDMQLRMKNAGKKRVLIDGPKIIHLEGQSSKDQKSHYFEEMTSYSSICNNVSRIYYCKKNVSVVKAFILKILLVLLWTNPMISKYNRKYVPNLMKGRMVV